MALFQKSGSTFSVKFVNTELGHFIDYWKWENNITHYCPGNKVKRWNRSRGVFQCIWWAPRVSFCEACEFPDCAPIVADLWYNLCYKLAEVFPWLMLMVDTEPSSNFYLNYKTKCTTKWLVCSCKTENYKKAFVYEHSILSSVNQMPFFFNKLFLYLNSDLFLIGKLSEKYVSQIGWYFPSNQI